MSAKVSPGNGGGRGVLATFGWMGRQPNREHRGLRRNMRAAMTGIGRIGRAYLGDQLSSRRRVVFPVNAGAPWAAARPGGAAFIAARVYLPGAGMSKGTITAKGEAKVLPGFHGMEIVQVDG